MTLSRATSRVGLFVSRAFQAIAPDPFVIAVLLLALTCLLGLTFGDFGSSSAGTRTLADKFAKLSDSFRDVGTGAHIWSLLTFAMQMCLVLVSGHVLTSTPVVRRAIAAIADWPRTGHSAAAMVGLIACLAGLINWGLALIVGALLARDVGRSLARRNIPHHYPIIAAAGYFGLMIWHGGLSGSAPLTMTSIDGAKRTLPAETVDQLAKAGFPQGVPLDHTLFTQFNLFISLGLAVIVPLALWFLAPRERSEQSPLPPAAATTNEPETAQSDNTAGPIPRFLERSPLITLLLAVALAAGLWQFFAASSLWKLGLNEITAAMLILGLVLHGSPARFVAAVDDAAKSCGGIIVQFPIYAAIIAVMVNTGLIRVLADLAASASPTWLPVTTFFSASIINLFVPSGGGQWAVQGPIALQAGLAQGLNPGRMIMAVAYGDQLTNMLQPFWALPLLAITGVKAREIVGYTAIVMLLGGAWIALGLLVL